MRGNLMGVQFERGEWDDALTKGERDAREAGWARQAFARAIRSAWTIASRAGSWTPRRSSSSSRSSRTRDPATPRLSCRRWSGSPGPLPPPGSQRRRGGGPRRGRQCIGRSESVGDVQEFHVELVVELRETGRRRRRELVARIPDGPWREACRAVVDGDDAAAADTLATVGTERLEADLRLRAARSLAATARLREAEAQLELARAFFRKVGATAYLAEADEIVAAAS